MKLINKTICIALVFSLLSSFVLAYSFTNKEVSQEICEIQKNIEKEYGVNLILPSDINKFTNANLEKCLAYIDRSLRCFPDGLIKEITSTYLNEGIKTNIIINKSEYNLLEIPADYNKTNQSANITINILTNNFYGTYDVSLDGIMHELGHFVSDYLFAYYGYDELEREFKKINSGYEYETWGTGYTNVFVNKNSAKCLNDDISDLIWYAEAHPDKLRNLGKKQIIHKKIDYLANVFDKCFESITIDSKLWLDAIPNDPDEWAEDIINVMEKEGLIPEEFEGKYDPYISREDFYVLALNLIKTYIGEDEFYNYFNIVRPEKSFNINPINGEVILEDDISNAFYNINLCNKKEDIYEAYIIGLINDLDEDNFGPEEYITNLESAKLSGYICEKFGIDTTKCDEAKFDDIVNLSDMEKHYINFAVNKGILIGDGNKFKPYEYCTYQETYIMLNRVYEFLHKELQQ